MTRIAGQDKSKLSGQQKNVFLCPVCGGHMRYSSYDPSEGHFYWCTECGAGPIGPYPNRFWPVTCNSCGKLVCSVRVLDGRQIVCRDYEDILSRTILDEPPNEKKIRGQE